MRRNCLVATLVAVALLATTWTALAVQDDAPAPCHGTVTMTGHYIRCTEVVHR